MAVISIIVSDQGESGVVVRAESNPPFNQSDGPPNTAAQEIVLVFLASLGVFDVSEMSLEGTNGSIEYF
jgi:hypothetical protein